MKITIKKLCAGISHRSLWLMLFLSVYSNSLFNGDSHLLNPKKSTIGFLNPYGKKKIFSEVHFENKHFDSSSSVGKLIRFLVITDKLPAEINCRILEQNQYKIDVFDLGNTIDVLRKEFIELKEDWELERSDNYNSDIGRGFLSTLNYQAMKNLAVISGKNLCDYRKEILLKTDTARFEAAYDSRKEILFRIDNFMTLRGEVSKDVFNLKEERFLEDDDVARIVSNTFDARSVFNKWLHDSFVFCYHTCRDNYRDGTRTILWRSLKILFDFEIVNDSSRVLEATRTTTIDWHCLEMLFDLQELNPFVCNFMLSDKMLHARLAHKIVNFAEKMKKSDPLLGGNFNVRIPYYLDKTKREVFLSALSSALASLQSNAQQGPIIVLL